MTAEFLRQRESNPVPVFTGEFSPMPRHCSWKYKKYSLRPLPCLDKNSLRKNCFAHFSEQDSRDFWRGGSSLADARQGQQSKKRRSMPLKCDTGSTSVALWNLFLRTGLPEAYLLYRKILGAP